MQINDQDFYDILNEISDESREADASICGYFYQIDLTLHRILSGSDNTKYLLEKMEDILEYEEKDGQINITAVQIKYNEGKVTNSDAYKAILYGYYSYHGLSVVQENLKKLNTKSSISIEIVFGTPDIIEVSKNTALDSIISCVPFDEKYSKFKASWNKNFCVIPPNSKPYYKHNAGAIKDYESILSVNKGESYALLEDEIINLVKRINSNSFTYTLPNAQVLYTILWGLLKKKMISCDRRHIKKEDLISQAIEEYQKVDIKTFETEYYKAFMHNKIMFIIDSVMNEILIDYQVRTIDNGHQTVYKKYESNIFPAIREFLYKNLDNRNKRMSFLNTIVPNKLIIIKNELNWESDIFLENKLYIKSFIKLLSKLSYFHNIDSRIKLEEKINTCSGLWKITGIDDRGVGVLIAADNQDLDSIKIGQIANKHIHFDMYYDVWYLRNKDGFRCNDLLNYEIDICKPIITDKDNQVITVNNLDRFYRIECLDCIKENQIHDCTSCVNITKEGCINARKNTFNI